MNTVGQIADRKDVPVHRVAYVVKARQIAAEGWADNSRVFSEAATRQIEDELDRLNAARSQAAETQA